MSEFLSFVRVIEAYAIAVKIAGYAIAVMIIGTVGKSVDSWGGWDGWHFSFIRFSFHRLCIA